MAGPIAELVPPSLMIWYRRDVAVSPRDRAALVNFGVDSGVPGRVGVVGFDLRSS